jgi:hypothetical protein
MPLVVQFLPLALASFKPLAAIAGGVFIIPEKERCTRMDAELNRINAMNF